MGQESHSRERKGRLRKEIEVRNRMIGAENYAELSSVRQGGSEISLERQAKAR